MRFLVLTGSPRQKGNTATLLAPFLEELQRRGHLVHAVPLHGRRIKPCVECFHCQKILDSPGCRLKDDMEALYPAILAADVIVWATPIFTWFCTPEMKAALDRFFCLSKTYNDLPEKPRLLAGKKVALITTFGDAAATGPDLFEAALRRECAYAGMVFLGQLGVRDIRGLEDFTCETAVEASRTFAATLGRGGSMELFIP